MKILVGYNGSDAASDAVKLAVRHAKAMDAELEVVYAITRFDPLSYHEVQSAEEKLEQDMCKTERIFSTAIVFLTRRICY